MMLRRKPGACSECYRLKKTCKYEAMLANPTTRSCDRCLRLEKKCIPRIIVRARTANKSGEASENANEPTSMFKILDDAQDLKSSFTAASGWVRAYNALGLSDPPVSLRWWIKGLYILAKRLKSVGRLHAATCLALSTGVPIDIQWLTVSLQPVHSTFVKRLKEVVFNAVPEDHDNRTGVGFATQQNAGIFNAATTPLFEWLFAPAIEIAKAVEETKSAPIIDFWPKFLENPEEAKDFLSQVILAALEAQTITAEPLPHVAWHITHDKRLRIKDKHGHVYTCLVHHSGFLACEGLLCWFTVSFRELEPVDEAGRAYLAAFERSRAAEPMPCGLHQFVTCSGARGESGSDLVNVAATRHEETSAEMEHEREYQGGQNIARATSHGSPASLHAVFPETVLSRHQERRPGSGKLPQQAGALQPPPSWSAPSTRDTAPPSESRALEHAQGGSFAGHGSSWMQAEWSGMVPGGPNSPALPTSSVGDHREAASPVAPSAVGHGEGLRSAGQTAPCSLIEPDAPELWDNLNSIIADLGEDVFATWTM